MTLISVNKKVHKHPILRRFVAYNMGSDRIDIQTLMCSTKGGNPMSGVVGGFTSTGAILVLFILLVIISYAFII